MAGEGWSWSRNLIPCMKEMYMMSSIRINIEFVIDSPLRLETASSKIMLKHCSVRQIDVRGSNPNIVAVRKKGKSSWSDEEQTNRGKQSKIPS